MLSKPASYSLKGDAVTERWRFECEQRALGYGRPCVFADAKEVLESRRLNGEQQMEAILWFCQVCDQNRVFSFIILCFLGRTRISERARVCRAGAEPAKAMARQIWESFISQSYAMF